MLSDIFTNQRILVREEAKDWQEAIYMRASIQRQQGRIS